MPPALRTTAGFVLLAMGLWSLLQFGFALLLKSPGLILGILLTAGGAALLSSGERNRFLP
jgi:hypothetical protein